MIGWINYIPKKEMKRAPCGKLKEKKSPMTTATILELAGKTNGSGRVVLLCWSAHVRYLPLLHISNFFFLPAICQNVTTWSLPLIGTHIAPKKKQKTEIFKFSLLFILKSFPNRFKKCEIKNFILSGRTPIFRKLGIIFKPKSNRKKNHPTQAN